MSAPTSPSLARALLLPILIAAALGALLFRPASEPKLAARPPLLVPVELDDRLVPISVQAPVPEPLPAPPSSEGLRSLRAP
jgi:hypothetical protein